MQAVSSAIKTPQHVDSGIWNGVQLRVCAAHVWRNKRSSIADHFHPFLIHCDHKWAEAAACKRLCSRKIRSLSGFCGRTVPYNAIRNIKYVFAIHNIQFRLDVCVLWACREGALTSGTASISYSALSLSAPTEWLSPFRPPFPCSLHRMPCACADPAGTNTQTQQY